MARWAGTSPPVVETFMSLNAGSHLETGSVSWSAPSSTRIIAATEAMGLVIE